MVLVRRIQKRNANIVVEANAEILFAETGDVGRWTNRFSQRVRTFAADEAPTNKRPRWGHYGKPLKSTMTASTTYQPNRLRVYSAIGSSARHAYYVNQGTGVYNGSSPWKAKVLPPWERGEPSLYEHTWRPGGGNSRVGTVFIKGQKAQDFLGKGLQRGFRSMRMRAYQVPGTAQISEASASFPTGLGNFTGNTEANSAFIASLTQWRAWRDATYNKGRLLGENGGYGTAEAARRRERRNQQAINRRAKNAYLAYLRAQRSAERSRQWRLKNKAKQTKPSQTKTNEAKKIALRAERQKFINAVIKKYGASNVELASLEFRGGYYYITVRVFTTREGDGQTRPEYKEIRGKSTIV